MKKPKLKYYKGRWHCFGFGFYGGGASIRTAWEMRALCVFYNLRIPYNENEKLEDYLP